MFKKKWRIKYPLLNLREFVNIMVKMRKIYAIVANLEKFYVINGIALLGEKYEKFRYEGKVK